jgi:hypothetical protein
VPRREPFVRVALLCLLVLSGCAQSPQLAMLNPRTGARVDCEVPNVSANAADFLISRACLSACEAHGFRPMPGVQVPSAGSDIPAVCSN